MRKELERITENMETVFRGDAWHGPNTLEIINSLPDNVITTKQAFSKRTIAQLIFHIYAWKKFAIEKLNDNIHYSLETEIDNWGDELTTSIENWPKLQQDLKAAHNELINLLEHKNDDLLEQRVPGEYYDYYQLLTGMIQHDTYHLGMVWVLWE